MDRLTNSPIGDCVVVRGHDHRFGEDFEVEAFIPHDLPSTIDLDHETWMAVTRASEQLGRLDAATELIPNPQLISRIATRREAVGTSALEGTYTNLPDLLAAEAIGPSPDNDGGSVPANVREVLNYTAAADAAHEWIRERPISIDMLSNLQAQIVRGTPAEGESGVLRERQVYIGPEDRPITEARFVPPPHGVHLRTMVERWVDWLVNEDVRAHLPAVVRIALAHYQFETLHPYVDGNGRVGRLVIILQLLSEGHLRAPALPVSIWLHRHGDEYRNHLRELSQTGDWSPWVRFFATAVAEQARDGHDKVMQLLTLQ
ncbi:MAG: Fic/DOC family N-terminal domain-containing protein, partial [Actinomycetota bacterium]